MNFALAQSMFRRPRVLRGGKAPLYWKRELSRLTGAWDSMPRRCDWVREIAETHPRLLSAPLLGTCLTAVTSNGVIQPERSNESSDPAVNLTSPHLGGNRSKDAASERVLSSKRQQVCSPSFANQRSENARHFETASQLPGRAPDSLLRRAAPGTLHVNKDLSAATTSPPHGNASSPPVNSQKLTRLEWLRLVADRAARRWITHPIFSSKRKYSSPTITGNRDIGSHSPAVSTQSIASDIRASASSATGETEFFPLLHDDWLLPIDGQQASPQLLASLVKHPGAARGTTEKIHRSKEPLGGIVSEPRGLPSSPDPNATEQRSFIDGPEFSRPPDRLFDRQSPAVAAESDRNLPLQSTFNSEEREQPASPNLAPTVLTPALWPLLPPPSAGAPVSPVAADSVRRIAWRDEVEAQQTDLSVLAAQVKRILDEEARRHGIDV